MDDTAIVLSEEKYRFIEKMGLYYESYGLPRIGGRILGLVLIADRPVSAEEISRLLRVSRSSVSTNLRLLLSFVLLEKVAVPGERSDYFEVSELAWRNTVKMRIEAYRNLQGIAEQGLAACDPAGSSNGKLLEMLRWVNALAESYEKLLAEYRYRCGGQSRNSGGQYAGCKYDGGGRTCFGRHHSPATAVPICRPGNQTG